MSRFLKVHPIVGFVIVLLVTTSVTLFGLFTLQNRDNADALEAHTHAVISAIDQASLGLANMQSGVRGYLLTGKTTYLDPYQSGKDLYEGSMHDLEGLTADNPSQMARWKEIQALAAQWEAQAAAGIALRNEVSAGKAPFQDILNYTGTGKGEALMVQLREKLLQGRQEENNLLIQRTTAGMRANALAANVTTWGLALAVILGLAVGLLLTRVNARNIEQIEMQRLLIAEREKERVQIARDLHDGPVQEMVGIVFALQALNTDRMEPAAAEQVEAIKTSIQEQISELRAYSTELRPPVLSRFGLEKTIRSHLDTFQEKHPEIKITFEAHQEGDILPEASRVALFRIYQQALNNIARHAQASEVFIQFTKDTERAVLVIRDNGVGFHVPGDWLMLARRGHLGLVGIRERAEAIGGSAEIFSRPGKGTVLRTVVPAK